MALLAPPDRGTAREIPPETFRFERRRWTRHGVRGTAMASVAAGVDPARVMPVELLDSSRGGLGVLAGEPVPVGASFALHRPGSPLPVLVGEVARCEQTSEGYRIGIWAEAAMAA